jgi:hypothetical protein
MMEAFSLSRSRPSTAENVQIVGNFSVSVVSQAKYIFRP